MERSAGEETPDQESVAPPQGSGGVAPPAAPTGAPADTDDTRGQHLSTLLKHPLTLSLGATLVIVALVGGIAGGGIAIGGAAAVGAALLVFLIVFVIASNRAKEDFFRSYANARSLSRASRGSVPPSTPLLRKGDRRYAEQIMDGTLPGGLPGAVALYTYEVETRDSDGDRDTTYYKFTVVLHDVPAAAAKVSDVHCQRRSGFRFMDSAEDAFRRMQRLELESEALDKRYEIFYGADDDQIWMKRFFSPSFIVWLTEQTPDGFAFEFSAGSLCVNVRNHLHSAAELDAICEAAGQVARRLADEASE